MSKLSLGLRENATQFWLLVLINSFVGAMVGLERELLPLLGEHEFGIASKVALLSFIATFGAVKALANYSAGLLADAWGRKRVLLLGWLFALPVPLLINWAPTWGWIIFANVLLGINQGLAWSSTVVMKVDLVGRDQRGLAMGLNEFAGYLALAAAAFAAGFLAQQFGPRPVPFLLGFLFAVTGLVLTLLFVRDTAAHARLEAKEHAPSVLRRSAVFADVTWRHPALASCSQAGLVNNLNDGVAWGLFPLLFAAAGLSATQITVLIAVYPAVWGTAQLLSGGASDWLGRRLLIVSGMLLQSAALVAVALAGSFTAWLSASALLGVGTALVYPTLLAAITDVAHPSWRGSAVGIYRLWRDSGYMAGALLGGAMADLFGIRMAILAAALVTLASGVGVALRMPETVPQSTLRFSQRCGARARRIAA